MFPALPSLSPVSTLMLSIHHTVLLTVLSWNAKRRALSHVLALSPTYNLVPGV